MKLPVQSEARLMKLMVGLGCRLSKDEYIAGSVCYLVSVNDKSRDLGMTIYMLDKSKISWRGHCIRM